MSSSFDQAMARPLLDEPARKKWSFSKPLNWIAGKKGAASSPANISNDDEDCEAITFGEDASTIECDNTANLTLDSRLFSICSLEPSSSDSSPVLDGSFKSIKGSSLFLEATLDHPLELPAPGELDQEEDGPLTTIELADLESADTDLELLRERQGELMSINTDMRQIHSIQQDLSALVDSHQSDIDRMSWNAIEAFDHTESGLEHLVKTIRVQRERRSRLYSLVVSTAIVLAVCYVIAGFFSPPAEDVGPAPSSSDINPGASPKFLIPYFQP